MILPSTFYDRSPLLVAPELLGKVLVSVIGGETVKGRIVEVEAYLSANDAAAHGFKGPTQRNQSLFKRAGHAYVHRIHMQHCLDVVTEGEGVPSGVLLRALEPIDGIALMQRRRNRQRLQDLCSGPGKLTQALGITKNQDGIDMTQSTSELYIVADAVEIGRIGTSVRIGISQAKELEQRFFLVGNPHLSR